MLMLALSESARAQCYWVARVGTATTTNLYEIRPGEGSARRIYACDTCNGSLGLPNVINVTSPEFQPPGTLLASGVATFMEYGNNVQDNPDMVFYRCAPEDAGKLFEMYSTNGDNAYSGHQNYEYGTSIGVSGGFATVWKDVISRLTNLETGEVFTNIWKARSLTGLDVDSRGFLLVKAKNLSRIRTELYRVAVPNGIGVTDPGMYGYTQPNAYIAFTGPGISGPIVGTNHLNNWPGWPDYWPGTIGLYGKVSIRRSATCSVNNVTPVVTFGTISIPELNAGSSRKLPFDIEFKCEATAVSGVATNATAMGILVSAGSLAAAERLGLVSGGGASYLLSDRYGSAGIASGVGIRIQRNNQNVKLLTSLNTGSNNSGGWYPAQGPASVLLDTQGGIRRYRETFSATLEKLAGQTVTAGRIEATAQVIIRVQ
ncbi:fimbrial protein [Pseudomonas sp. Fl4BN1]|uniref:fimbrial protein n=1 Tax=Pseudomonas sp. Fl4BN1 TaxID=2697651 RepID=UPI001377FA46|nr:fimbrial protein [Pseudomonas sp. Fl4BN1]